MRKVLFILLLILTGNELQAQQTFRTTSGEVHFNASTPLEDIDARNKKVNAILKTESGDFASVLLVREFEFRRKLMQEHFNENFMESGRFPKAHLRAKLQGLDSIALSAGGTCQLVGTLTIHGVSREFNTRARLRPGPRTLLLEAAFVLRPEDFDIEVPKILFNKIAEEVDVKVSLPLEVQ